MQLSRKITAGLILFTALALPASRSGAASFYVDVNYDLSNGDPNGSSSRPYTNITAAVYSANTNGTARDQIYIADGLYMSISNGGYENFGSTGLAFTGFADVLGGYEGISGGVWSTARVPRSTIIDLTASRSRAFTDGGLPTDQNQGISYEGLTFRNASNNLSGATLHSAGGYRVCMRINNCLFTNNWTSSGGGSVNYQSGGTWGYILNSDFISNVATGSAGGGAVYGTLSYAQNLFTNNLFRGNLAGGKGGALFLSCSANSGARFILDNCLFTDNISRNDGGAVFCNDNDGSWPLLIQNSRFFRNACATNRFGAAVGGNDYWNGEYELRNCLLVGNSNSYAIYANGYRVNTYQIDLWNCTIMDNPQGGVYATRSAGTDGLRVRNSLIVSNGPAGIYYNKNAGAAGLFTYNNVFGHTADYLLNAAAGTGSISNEPGLVGGGDFHLLRTSPCVDAAENIGLMNDLDGVLRPTRFGFDIGCYEEWQLPVITNRTSSVAATEADPRAEFLYESQDIATYAWFAVAGTDAGTNSLDDWTFQAYAGEPALKTIFGATVTGLSPDTVYWYRCFASNSYDTWWGPASSFRTAAAGGTTRLWTGGGTNALASNTNNWQGGILPSSTDYILLDSASSNLIWDAGSNGLPAAVARWTQTENYTGTVTFATFYPGQGVFTNFSISGDVLLANGRWTHVTNPTGEIQVRRLQVTVGGDFTMEAAAAINADGQGYRGYRGPGKPYGPGDKQHGAAHGGQGAMMEGFTFSGNVYGSVVNPETLGSGGGRSDTPNAAGGGAILLTVAGDAVLRGVITANGVFSGDTNGSGGSVNLVARTLGGNGIVRANGGSGNYADSGGGRIAVRLTGPGADFSSFTGSLQTYGGSRAHVSGAAGTIYKQLASEAEGAGTLVIDNGNRTPYLPITTPMPSNTSLQAFGLVIVTNGANLGITSNDTINLGLVNLQGSGTNAYVSITSAAGVTFPDPFVVSNYMLVGAVPLVATGEWTIASRGGITHPENYRTSETYRLSFTLDGNLTMNGTINVNRKGYRGGYGPGRPTQLYAGASYGGRGGFGQSGSTLAGVGITYGSIKEPVNVGSGSGRNDGSTRAGGGAVILTVSGHLAVNGSIRSEAEYEADTVGSGGSVNITAGTMSGAGPISANGHYYYGGSGGGRVALRLTDSGADFTSYTGTVTAYGGNSTTAAYDGGPGTVWRQWPAGAQLTLANFNGASVGTGVGVLIQESDLRPAVLSITNTAVWISTNTVRVKDLVMAAGSTLNLNSNILYVGSLEHPLGGTVVTNSGQIIWLRKSGAVMLLR